MRDMKNPLIIGVMGGGSATSEDKDAAYRLGKMIASQGWILLNGGRNAGIMAASAKGARDQGGITVGILPDEDCSKASSDIMIPVVTGMGSARNSINVLSSNFVVACPGGTGTISEIALALKYGKTVILLGFEIGIMFEQFTEKHLLYYAETPDEVIGIIKELMD